MVKGATTHDTLLEGRLRLEQYARGHRAGTDALLLAGSVSLESGLAVDFGAGVGTAGLVFALRNPGCRMQLVEREAALLTLARNNIATNGLQDRVEVIEANLFAREPVRVGAGLQRGKAALVLTNPPFFTGTNRRSSPEPLKRTAHEMTGGDLPGWLRAAASCLSPGGRLALIHRADALADLVTAARVAFGGIALRFVHAQAEAPAIRVLLTAVKGSRAPLTVQPPLILGRAMESANGSGRSHAPENGDHPGQGVIPGRRVRPERDPAV